MVDTRQRILIEASRLFSARGYFGTSTRAIADAVGIQQPSLFHHFPTKQSIMTELLEVDLETALQMMKRETSGPGTAVVRLLRYLVEDIYLLLSSPYDLVVNNHAAVLTDPEFARFDAIREELRAMRVALVEQCVEEGSFAEIPVDLAHQLITALVLGSAILTEDLAVQEIRQGAIDASALAIRSLLADPTDIALILQQAEYESTLPVLNGS